MMCEDTVDVIDGINDEIQCYKDLNRKHSKISMKFYEIHRIMEKNLPYFVAFRIEGIEMEELKFAHYNKCMEKIGTLLEEIQELEND